MRRGTGDSGRRPAGLGSADELYDSVQGRLRALAPADLKRVAESHSTDLVRAAARNLLDGLDEEIKLERAKAERRRDFQRGQALLVEEYRSSLESDFLSADSRFRDRVDSEQLRELFHAVRLDFVASWVERETGRRPDAEQSAAICAIGGDVQVIARAGSGKTATIVNRALFLAKHCGVPVSEMLLLAFNVKAVKELRDRLEAMLDGRCPHVMTFHALAYRITHPLEHILTDGSDDDGGELSQVVHNLIKGQLADPAFHSQIRDLMLAHFREDWESLVAGGYDKGVAELLAHRRALPLESLRGEPLKSRGEKVIADFLFQNDVRYNYEESRKWGSRPYRPDFTIHLGGSCGVAIEYFGLTGDPDYDEDSRLKKEYWQKQKGWTLLALGPSDLAAGRAQFEKTLEKRLAAVGVVCRALSEDEIWERIHVRAITRFQKLAVGFIGRCRTLGISPVDLGRLVGGHNSATRAEELFLEAIGPLLSAYLRRLEAVGEEDFSGLLYRAADLVNAGKTTFEGKAGRGDLRHVSHIFIDEFQDFSQMFYSMTQAIRGQNAEVQYFCVGDDWQAINGFAGSDLRFFSRFEEFFTAQVAPLQISTNYRSSPEIVAVGNRLMSGRGPAARANKTVRGEVLFCDLAEFEPTAGERELHAKDRLTPAVLRCAQRSLQDGKEVAILSRTNKILGLGIGRYESNARSFFPEELQARLHVSNTHKYKGLEQPTVVILDAVARSYPLIHPDWVFSRIFGDTLEMIVDAERRLFYVAITRAESRLILVTERDDESMFLKSIALGGQRASVLWAAYPPVRTDTDRLTICVADSNPKMAGGGTYPIRQQLRSCGFDWLDASTGSHWWRRCAAADFDVAALMQESWAIDANGVEVSVRNDGQQIIEMHEVAAGNRWSKVV